MDGFFRLSGLLGILAALAILARSRTALRNTTLTVAWGWGVAAMSAWAALWLADAVCSAIKPGLADRLWYSAAVLMLCAPIAVLGSRRPATRVWLWFVILPMFIVLGLPVVSTWQGGLAPRPLRLEAPAVVSFGLVLVMGAGNYLGTRFTLPAVLFAVALLLLIAPLSAAVPDTFPAASESQTWATICLSASTLLAWRQSKTNGRLSPSTGHPMEACDRLWIDFRDFFGIVWARRIQDRINAVAAKEQWPVRLEMHGIVWIEKDSSVEKVHAAAKRISQTFRWLLRRFVDPAWIDQRLMNRE